MPCYTATTITIEFKAKHKDLIFAAAEAEGLQIQEIYGNRLTVQYGELVIDLDDQTAEIRNKNYALMNRMKRAYSKAAIEKAARKKKWAVKQMGANKLRARRY